MRRCSIQRSRAAAGQTPGSPGLAQTATACPAPCWSVLERRTSSVMPRSATTVDVAEGECDQFRAAQRGAEAEQQHRPGRARRAACRRRAVGQHQAQHAGHRRGGLAARADALRPGDALDHHGEAGVAQVEGEAGQQMRGADRGEVHADRADGKATVAGEPSSAQRTTYMAMVSGSAASGSRPRLAAPGVVLPPGGAVGAAGAVAAGAGGVDRGAAGELLELARAGGAVGHAERAEQGRLQGQRPVRGRLIGAGQGACCDRGRGRRSPRFRSRQRMECDRREGRPAAASSGDAASGRAGVGSWGSGGLRSSWWVMARA